MEWFRIYTNWGEAVEMLSDDEAGRLFKNIFALVLRGEKRKGTGREDLLMSVALPIMLRDIEKYEAAAAEEERKAEKRRLKAQRAARLRWGKQHAGGNGEHDAESGEHTAACGENNGHARAGENTEVRCKEGKKEEIYSKPEGKTNTDSCSGLPSAAPELPAAEIPLNDGSVYPLYRRDLDEYAALYPAADIEQELRNIRGWCMANPTRRKTRRGIRRFINGWLSRAQDKGGAQARVPENPFLPYARGEKEIGEYLL